MVYYTPRFTTSQRMGKTAIWVTMPAGDKWNIGDLNNASVFEGASPAIIHAFELGFRAHELLMADNCLCISTGTVFRRD